MTRYTLTSMYFKVIMVSELYNGDDNLQVPVVACNLGTFALKVAMFYKRKETDKEKDKCML